MEATINMVPLPHSPSFRRISILVQTQAGLISFHLYFYFPDSYENVRGAIHRESNYRDLLLEMPRYRVPAEIFFRFREIQLQFKTVFKQGKVR